MKLTDNQRKVLEALVDDYDTSGWDETGFYSFNPLAKKTELERRVVRLACRSLTRKGLAKFGRGLVTEDGEMAGAGYCATKEGALVLKACIECKKEIAEMTDGRCDLCWENRQCSKCGKSYKDHELKNGHMVEFEYTDLLSPQQ